MTDAGESPMAAWHLHRKIDSSETRGTLDCIDRLLSSWGGKGATPRGTRMRKSVRVFVWAGEVHSSSFGDSPSFIICRFDSNSLFRNGQHERSINRRERWYTCPIAS